EGFGEVGFNQLAAFTLIHEGYPEATSIDSPPVRRRHFLASLGGWCSTASPRQAGRSGSSRTTSSSRAPSRTPRATTSSRIRRRGRIRSGSLESLSVDRATCSRPRAPPSPTARPLRCRTRSGTDSVGWLVTPHPPAGGKARSYGSYGSVALRRHDEGGGVVEALLAARVVPGPHLDRKALPGGVGLDAQVEHQRHAWASWPAALDAAAAQVQRGRVGLQPIRVAGREVRPELAAARVD